MKVAYELRVQCNCPVDGRGDVYDVTIVSDRTIFCEKINEVTAALSSERIPQEELTDRLHRELRAEVTTVGWHSGVKVTATAR